MYICSYSCIYLTLKVIYSHSVVKTNNANRLTDNFSTIFRINGFDYMGVRSGGATRAMARLRFRAVGPKYV